MNETSEWFPDPTPQEDEVVLDDDPAFVEAYMSRVADDAKQFGWHFGKSILTHSKVWGRVWRIDFATASSRYGGNLVSRAICWQPPESVDIGLALVIGQAIAKLG